MNLFVLWIDVADHPHFSVPPYDLALLTNFLNRWSNFHFFSNTFLILSPVEGSLVSWSPFDFAQGDKWDDFGRPYLYLYVILPWVRS